MKNITKPTNKMEFFNEDPLSIAADFLDADLDVEMTPETIRKHLKPEQIKRIIEDAIKNNLTKGIKNAEEAFEAFEVKSDTIGSLYRDTQENKWTRVPKYIAESDPNRYIHERTYKKQINGKVKCRQTYWDNTINDFVKLYKEDVVEGQHIHKNTWKAQQRKLNQKQGKRKRLA